MGAYTERELQNKQPHEACDESAEDATLQAPNTLNSRARNPHDARCIRSEAVEALAHDI